MASPSLTLRNLTSTPLELIRLERYTSPTESPGISSFVKVLKRNDTSSTAAARPSSTQDVSVRVEPFRTSTTDIKAPDQPTKETTLLTFENDGEKHQMVAPSPSNASTESTPMSPNPRFNYTAIYLPQKSYLALFSSANLSSWMSQLKDETPLSALSIPGTHNSPTHHRALPSVRCQAVSVQEQLDHGFRFLDIRVQPEEPENASKEGLILVHGVFPISLKGKLYFRDLVNEVFAFLDKNPSETVIMSVKREGPGNHTDAQLSRRLRDHYAGDVNHWFTAPRIPTLGEARHKIVLMRRFTLEDGLKHEWDGQGWCINAESWAYNTPNDTCPSGDVCVQDFCEVLETENIDVKIKYSEEQLNRAACCVANIPGVNMQQSDQQSSKQPFYINFLSASNFWKVGCWPEKIAAKINPAIIEYLCTRHGEVEGTGDASTGIVVCDWVGKDGDWDLVRCIVGMNARMELKEKNMG